MSIQVPRDVRSPTVAPSPIARRVLAGQRALVTGATLYADGGVALCHGFRAGG